MRRRPSQRILWDTCQNIYLVCFHSDFDILTRYHLMSFILNKITSHLKSKHIKVFHHIKNQIKGWSYLQNITGYIVQHCNEVYIDLVIHFVAM